MSASSLVAVTGGTGRLGQLIVKGLDQRGAPNRVLSRRPATKPSPSDAGSEWFHFDWDDPSTFNDAVRGVATLFVSTPFSVAPSQVQTFIDAAVIEGVQRIVQLSALDAARMPLLPLDAIARIVESSEVDTLVVEADWFMQNFLHEPLRPWIAAGEILGCAGDGAATMVDARDVAEVCAAALVSPATGRMTVTGPDALTMEETATIIADACGREVRYIDIAPRAFEVRLVSEGVPAVVAPVLVELFEHFGAPASAPTSDAVEALTGYRARSMANFASEYADDWSPLGARDGRNTN